MTWSYPHTIENGSGEQLTFVRRVSEPDGDRLIAHNLVLPGAGPPMHVHHMQAESLTVIRGRIAVQLLGEEPTEHGPGETATFPAGIAHRFWNAGSEPLECEGWIKPADNLEYFLSEIYRSTRENGGARPAAFDSAYLLRRYATEFDMLEIPPFVRRVIFPLALAAGYLTGKQKRFAEAPPPIVRRSAP